MKKLVVGIYDLLHTRKLQDHLEAAGLVDSAVWCAIEPEESYHSLAVLLSKEIEAHIQDCGGGIESVIKSPEALISIIESMSPVSMSRLQQIKPPHPLVASLVLPDTPLAVSALLTGSSRSPALRSQLIKELATCDRADWLVSFIKFSGILPLLPTLRQFTLTPTEDGSPKLRIATTSYMGATDSKAVKALLELPNTEVRVSYDTQRTRLHAKAYLFHRATGFGSAYIGSANVSKAALDEGLEWTAKVSQYETEHLWNHAIATFESHWEDETEFTRCSIDDISDLEKALATERGGKSGDQMIPLFNLRPYGYQQAILDDIKAERGAGKFRHLVIAATGTGKTMIAAFDYLHFSKRAGKQSRLLFVAHREEILKQAMGVFRQVLRDANFGDMVCGGCVPSQDNHLFCTVQSWNSRTFDKFPPNHFDYVVLDEAHHGSAKSYQKLINHISPMSLLGLTATPERTDGQDIRVDFGGAFTHEVRLPAAIERALLSPFHYYGIPDLEGLDFSSLAWKNGGYEVSQLRSHLEANSARARWVMDQVESHVADISTIRGLGFCVSVVHAHFMAEFCNSNSIPAIALTGETAKDVRRDAQRKLQNHEIRFIFTVDLYNEGVDIPSVDTVLFLRPTESLTLFLQQLGRGLRLYDDKSHLTVLDFIAPQHRSFRFARRFQALTSRPEIRIDRQVELDMPYVPSGCFIHLEKRAKDHVLRNIREATANLKGKRLLAELQVLSSRLGNEVSLQNIMDCLHLDSPDEIYKRGLPHVLMAEACGTTDAVADLSDFDGHLAKGMRRFLLMDDTHLINDALSEFCSPNPFGNSDELSSLKRSLIHTVLWGAKRPGGGTLSEVEEFFASRPMVLHDLKELLNWLMDNRTPLQKKQFEAKTGPLNLHGAYSREQVVLALGLGSFGNPRNCREGVLHVPDRKLDIFFADINKSETDFSPTTMYDDYAITDKLFHWQSQSATSDRSPVGERYINHQERGYTPMLFIRDRKKLANKLTSPYLFAGPLRYKKHSGSKPVSFIWELECALPARALSWARRIG